MAKKKMMKKENGDKCMMCGMSYSMCKCKTWYIAAGIVAVILGISLWYNWLDLQQTVAIILVLIGIKKIVKCAMWR